MVFPVTYRMWEYLFVVTASLKFLFNVGNLCAIEDCHAIKVSAVIELIASIKFPDTILHNY